MRALTRTLSIAALLAAGTLAVGCDDDDDDDDFPGDGDGDGDGLAAATFQVRVENIGVNYPFIHSGKFDTGVSANAPGPIGPGDAFEVRFTAGRGQHLSFATMFAASNDFFFAPGASGIALFDDDGEPIRGDVTDQVALWNAGTELDQEPGLGADQATQQASPDQGAADPDGTVRLAEDTFGNLPDVDDVIRVTLTPGPGQQFLLLIENVSNPGTLQTSNGQTQAVPLSPGVFAVHEVGDALFTPGTPDRADGLEAIAEDGRPAALEASLAEDTGITVALSPGVFIVHRSGSPIFEPGEADRQEGLEPLAEDGDPSDLAAALAVNQPDEASGVFDTATDADDAGPIRPGQAFEFTIDAEQGQRLSLATMFAQSNDLFLAPDAAGILLFENDGEPFTGEVTVALWDTGTEANQEPGVGNDQAPRQLEPDSGNAEKRPVAPVDNRNDQFVYPSVKDFIRVTVTPISE